ncbi:universal stress protein [Propionibacteriaceae bacterium Y2011]
MESPYTVVVGVSPTSKSPTALQWAVAQARLNEGRVIAVRAWPGHPPMADPGALSGGRVPTAATVEAELRRQFVSDVADVLGADHDVELQLVRGGRRKALNAAARDADLLVVDAPQALTTGPMFAHRVIYSAACPVVVMPPQIAGAPPTWRQHLTSVFGREAFHRSRPTAARPPD